MSKTDMSKETLLLFLRFCRYLKPYRKEQLLLLSLLVVSSAGALVTPYALKIIVDDIFQGGNYKQLTNILFILVSVYILRIICTIVIDLTYSRISSGVIAAIQVDMVRCIINKHIHFYRENRAGDILFTLQGDVSNIQTSFLSGLISYLIDCLTISGIVAMLLMLNVELALISFLIIPIILGALHFFAPLLRDKFKNVQEVNERLSTFLMEKIRNYRVIKSYKTHDYEIGKLGGIHREVTRANAESAFLSSMNSSVLTFFVAIGPIVILAFGGRDVFSGLMTVGSLIAYIQYLNKLYAPTVNLANGYSGFSKAIVSMKRVQKYIDDDVKSDIATDSYTQFSKVSFKNVSFEAKSIPILKNISLQFEKGQIYGIIGPSGCGKSSVVNLLCGFVQPTAGYILVDDKTPIQQVGNWCDELGLVERENQLFDGTILDNVRYGRPAANEEEAWVAAGCAELSGVIDRLPNGIHSIVNDVGGCLSDGQKQRISIARALVGKNNIIIMDEATSSIELSLERKIIETLRRHFSNSIVIVVTHRMESLKLMDYIYSIEEGRVSSQGIPETFGIKYTAADVA